MKTSSELIIAKNKFEFYQHALGIWQKLARQAIVRHGRFAVALSGGQSPADFYRRLSRSTSQHLWPKTHLFLVDERYVPFQHAESNFRMIKENLLDYVDIPSQNIHPIPTHHKDVQTDALRYEREIQTFFKLKKNQRPRFDLIFLGLGKDGHVASLFPGEAEGYIDPSTRPSSFDRLRVSPDIKKSPRAQKNRLVLLVAASPRRSPRITLSLPVINEAKAILVFVQGEEKAGILKKALEDKRKDLPIHHVRPRLGRLFFLVDREAASLLS